MLKVDGAYVAVKFPGTSSNTNCQNNSGSDADPSSLLQDCRLLRIDELQVSVEDSLSRWMSGPWVCYRFESKIPFVMQVVKTGGTPKVPDCFQRTPKKLCIPEKTEILAVNVDSKGKRFCNFANWHTPCSINTCAVNGNEIKWFGAFGSFCLL